MCVRKLNFKFIINLNFILDFLAVVHYLVCSEQLLTLYLAKKKRHKVLPTYNLSRALWSVLAMYLDIFIERQYPLKEFGILLK